MFCIFRQSEDSGSIANLTYQLEQVVDWIGNFQTEREHNSFRLSSKDSVIRELRLELFEKNKRLDEQAIELSKSQVRFGGDILTVLKIFDN